MKTVPIESLRRHLGETVRSDEPILVTRYGKLAGVFYPLPDPKKVRRRLEEEAAAAPKRRRGGEKQLPLIKGE
jgi:hypothetical protein